MVDKYATGQDPYCYPGTMVLRNRLGLLDDKALNEAERSLSEIAASEIEFSPPPYDLPALHRQLFGDLYEWAGELRTLGVTVSRLRNSARRDNLSARYDKPAEPWPVRLQPMQSGIRRYMPRGATRCPCIGPFCSS